jgi:hypothetical protein
MLSESKIVLGIGSAGYKDFNFDSAMDYGSLILCTKHESKVNMVIMGRRSAYIGYNMDKIVMQAQDFGCTHLLFIEVDMRFPADGALRLLKRDKLVVGGTYNYKVVDKDWDHSKPVITKPLVLYGNAADPGPLSFVPREQMPKEIFKEFDGYPIFLSNGFILIDMRVFQQLKPPWFFFEKRGERMDGQDVTFSMNCHKAGIDTWCDPTIPLGHIGDFTY